MREDYITKNKIVLENFLQNRPIQPQFRLPEDEKPFGYIYCIENLKNGRKYIGSSYATWVGIQRPRPTTCLRKRATQYIYSWNKGTENGTASIRKIIRPITRALVEEGIENFVMYPIAETTKDSHNKLENFFIEAFSTMDPSHGYNACHATNTTYKHSKRSLTGHEKLLRSESVYAVHLNDKQLVRADSMKLLADFLGTSKDMIKNVTRKGMPYRGWFVFYEDEAKRSSILVNNVINDQDKRKQDRHSEKAKQFYQNLYDVMSSYINGTDKTSCELFPDFNILPDLVYTD